MFCCQTLEMHATLTFFKISSSRRMFPPIKVELFNLEPSKPYVLLIDMSPVDKFRYKYQNSAWVKCFEEECSPTRLYIHPDSPALGSHWMNTVVSFYKLKLTNNQLDKQGHVSYSLLLEDPSHCHNNLSPLPPPLPLPPTHLCPFCRS